MYAGSVVRYDGWFGSRPLDLGTRFREVVFLKQSRRDKRLQIPFRAYRGSATNGLSCPGEPSGWWYRTAGTSSMKSWAGPGVVRAV